MRINYIYPYKGRKINYNKSVLVYRNLHKKGKVYSLKQDGLIVGHSTRLALRSCKFIVNQTGRLKTLKTKTKNIHAYIKGEICRNGCMGVIPIEGEQNPYYNLPVKISYDPYKNKTFIGCLTGSLKFPIVGCAGLIINQKCISAAYTY